MPASPDVALKPTARKNQVLPEVSAHPSSKRSATGEFSGRAARPLQAAGADEFLSDNIVRSSEYRGQKSERTFHLFVNQTSVDVELFWFYDGGETRHGLIPPDSNLYVGTYTYHQWRLQDLQGRALGHHSGPSAMVVLYSDKCEVVLNPSKEDTAAGIPVITSDGVYRRRTIASGMGIWVRRRKLRQEYCHGDSPDDVACPMCNSAEAFDCVADEAVQCAEHVIGRVLEHCPRDLQQALVSAGAALGIIGRDQVVSDLPPHAFMKHNRDRNLDKTARGLGATPHIPVTSVGEENLTMVHDTMFSCQSILVHELGHTVMNLAFDQARLARVSALFKDSRKSGRYPQDIYSMCNEQEYWACAVEAWFEATVRTDINAGINTRQKLLGHDPELAVLLAEVFGNGTWRYQHDSPLPLVMPAARRAAIAAAKALAISSAGPSQAIITLVPLAPLAGTQSSDGAGLMPREAAPPLPGPAPLLGLQASPLCFSGSGGNSCWPLLFSSCMPHARRLRDERTMQ